VFAAADGDRIAALVFDWRTPQQTLSNRSFYTRLQPAADVAPARLRLTALKAGDYRLRVRRTGY